MSDPSPEQVCILLAEDDDGHAELIIDQLRGVGLRNPIQRFRDGDELWSFLESSQGSCDDAAHWLLLLDIRMPRMDGTEVLRRIKQSPVLQRLPVIMLTTTDDPREVEHCYALGCNAYVTKPVEFSAFSVALERLGLFLLVVRTPRALLPSGPV